MPILAADSTTARQRDGLERIESVVACTILFAAAWTLLVHFSVAMGLSYARLFQIFPCAVATGFILILWKQFTTFPVVASTQNADDTKFSWLYLLAAVAAVLIYFFSNSWNLFLIGAGVILITAAYFLRRRARAAISADSIPANKAQQIRWLIPLCLVAAAATLLLHRPDVDDAFYLASAVNAAHHRAQPVWSTDAVFGQPGLPILMPVYKVESYELFIGFLSHLLHLSSIRVAHTLLPPFLAAFTVLSWSLLAADLDRRRWLFITAVAIVVAFLDGQTHRSAGNFTFLRMQQGKSVLASACVPLFYHYGHQFLLRPDWRYWLLWLAAVIAAIGFSSTAIALAPVVIAVILLSDILISRRLRWALLAAMGVLLYPLFLGLLLKHQMDAVSWVSQTPPETPTQAIAYSLGSWQCFFFLFALLSAWAVVPNRKSAAMIWSSAVILLLVLFNPFIGAAGAQRLFSSMTYWRALWIIPFPIWGAALIVGIAGITHQHLQPRLSKIPARTAAVLVTLAMLCLLGWYPIWQTDELYVGLAKLDVDPAAYSAAQQAAALTPPRCSALAPEIVSSWIATLEHRPRLVCPRVSYVLLLQNHFGAEETSLRSQLCRLAAQSNFAPADLALLDRAVGRFSIGAIVLIPSTSSAVAPMLRQRGFVQKNLGAYTLWHRPMASRPIRR